MPNSQIRKLELLTRDEIVEVLKRAGVAGPDPLLRELVDQSANKPGLAVTLARLYLRGDWQRIASGEALTRSVLTPLEALVHGDVEPLLAAFALGGDRGMTMQAVGNFLGMSRAEVREKVVGLAAGGVLSEVDRDALAVWPRQLRAALVASVFFQGAGTDLDYRPLLEAAPDFDSAVEVVLWAAGRGGGVPPDELRQLVVQADSKKLWQILTRLGEANARWALANYSGSPVDLAGEALLHVPDSVVPLLLEHSAGSKADSSDFREPDLGELRSWVEAIDQPVSELLRRRRLVSRHAASFLGSGGDPSVGLGAVAIALSPSVRGSGSDPGSGRTVSFSQGLLPTSALREVAGIWRDVRSVLPRLDAESWSPVSQLLNRWMDATQHTMGRPVSPETEVAMAEFASTLLTDLVPKVAGDLGLSAELKRIGARIGIDLPLPDDPVFELLRPDEWDDAETAGGETRQDELQKLADEWVSDRPAEVARQLARYETEVNKAHRHGPRRFHALCTLLSKGVDEPEPWIEAFLVENVPGEWVEPFLRRVVTEERPGWVTLLSGCLERDQVAWFALKLALTAPRVPDEVLHRALATARRPRFPMVVESLCHSHEVPVATLRALLEHEEPEVALAAAVGEWCGQPRGEVDASISAEWRSAVLRAKSEEYEDHRPHSSVDFWLKGIIGSDGDLALDWWLARIEDDERPAYVFEGHLLATAIRALDSRRRIRLLDLLDESWPLHQLIPLIVGRDPEIFRAVLGRPSLREDSLTALEGIPDRGWADLASLAIEAGYSVGEVAGASFSGAYAFSGFGQEYWGRWRKAFAALEEDPRPAIREAARVGREIAEKRIAAADAEEKQSLIHGF